MRTRMLMSVFALAAVATPAAAQSEWLAAEGTSVAVEYRHPVLADVPDDADMSMLNGAFFVSGRFQIPVVGIAGVAELPVAYAKFGEGDTELSSTTVGNIYIGAELPILLGAATITGGIRVPTAADLDLEKPSTFIGPLASFTDRSEAFIPDAITPQLGVRVGVPGIPVVDVEANLEGAYIIYGGEDEDDPLAVDQDNDFLLNGGVRAFAGVMGLRLGAGFEGVMNLTTEDDDDSDSSFYQAGLWADYSFGMVRPGVSFFIPLSNDYSDAVDYLVGLSLEVDLPM